MSEEAALPEKTFVFSDFPAKTLSGIRLRLTQTGEGKGIAYLTFTQTCGSRGSDVASGPDWVFDVNLSDGKAPLSETFISAPGTTADFSWVQGSINPVVNAQRANLKWRSLQRVHDCG